MAFDPRLASAFNFDETDLSANREGRLSVEQERLLANTVHVHSRLMRSRGRLFFGAVAVAALGVVAYQASTTGLDPVPLAVAGGALAWITAIALVVRRRGSRLVGAFRERVVRTASGAASIEPRVSSGTSFWGVTIGGVTFEVDGSVGDALQEGTIYRLHYLRGPADVIPLSVEPATG